MAIDNGGTVIADGKLVTLLIDTTGFDAGTFDLRLSGSDGPDSNFVLPNGVEFFARDSKWNSYYRSGTESCRVRMRRFLDRLCEAWQTEVCVILGTAALF